MTAQAAPASTSTGRTLGELVTSIPMRPVEGWLSLIASAVMVVAVAASLLDAGWTGSVGDAGFLPWVGLVGLAFGIGGAKVGWGRWRTHAVGALFAGIALPLIVGGIVIGHAVGWDPHSLALRMTAALDLMRNVWTDLVVEGRPFTTEIAHYHLVFGTLIWGAGMLTGFTVFGHRRPLDAVVVLGLVLLTNMALTSREESQLVLLIVFSTAALLLLIRTHVFEEEVTWARRKIGDPAAVSQLYLTGGAMFVTGAVLGAILLTATASSAPLQGLWADFPRSVQSLTQWLQRFAPPGGDFRGLGAVTFGDKAVTTGQWLPSNRIAFRAQFPANEKQKFKWRAGTFSEYTTFGWNWGPTRTESTTADAPLLAGDVNGDKATDTLRRPLTFEVRPDAFTGPTVLSPNMIVSVDRSANTRVLGTDGWFTTVESNDSLRAYRVTALIPVKEGGITEPVLRAAGTDYPQEIRDLYLQLPKGAIGDKADALLTEIRAQVVVPPYADAANPYDLARTMQAYLNSDDHFKYKEDVRSERNARCKDVSTVECFAIIKVGYCDYYASTMVVLLRASSVPARIAYGFLPGDRDPVTGVEQVGAWLAHYWVEVYFPEIGWIEFDPTGGNIGDPQVIPSGSPIPGTPKPTGSGSTFKPTAKPSATAGAGGGTTTTPGTGIGPFIAIGIILVVGVGALIIAALRRTPRKPMHPDQAWGSVARLAARFGLGPRPSQTVYEYAGSLGDAVPAARVELTTIARAKVEVAYGNRDLGTDRLRSIAAAYQRLRLALLGVIVRRGFRRRPRRG
ncbi:MAG: transglutaminase domain-containing protein [Chloroflexi bacterium]|nr:transglutaminase domain-containing protein [Chloroflexota bacterium]